MHFVAESAPGELRERLLPPAKGLAEQMGAAEESSEAALAALAVSNGVGCAL